MLEPEQKALLLTGAEFDRDSIEHLNRTLVVGSDVMADMSYKASKTLNEVLITEHDVKNFNLDDSILDDLREIEKRADRINKYFDKQIIEYNPHIEDVRVR
jgi:hypothetical protein